MPRNNEWALDHFISLLMFVCFFVWHKNLGDCFDDIEKVYKGYAYYL